MYMYSLMVSYNLYMILHVCCFCVQSDSVQSSALTIIPVHDDNVDLEYEPVS